jgi:hypothetical protein
MKGMSMKIKNNLQIINFSHDTTGFCNKCGHELILGAITYTGICIDTADSRQEEYKCNKCGSIFIAKYDIFDSEHHINPSVFNGDPNDPSFSFEELWTAEQQKTIAEHLLYCRVCQNRRDLEFLSDVCLASLLHDDGRKH